MPRETRGFQPPEAIIEEAVAFYGERLKTAVNDEKNALLLYGGLRDLLYEYDELQKFWYKEGKKLQTTAIDEIRERLDTSKEGSAEDEREKSVEKSVLSQYGNLENARTLLTKICELAGGKQMILERLSQVIQEKKADPLDRGHASEMARIIETYL